jgi:YaiO family outer membrane protein
MHIVPNKHTCLVLLALMGLVANHYGQSTASGSPAETIPIEQTQDEPANPWTLVPSYSWSFFNKGRDSWQKESIDLYYYLAAEKLLLGASFDRFHRPPNGDDIVYGFTATWYARPDLELHGEISLTQDADFLPNERYSVGLQYRLNQQIGFLFDVEHMEFGSYAPTWENGLTQIRPGLSYWFTEKSFVTLRYTHGWVHGEADYDYYSAKINFGDLPRDGQLSIGLAYGTDPDLGFGTIGTALSDAYTFSIFYKEPINPDLSIFAGVEYVYRLRPDNGRELYQMWTPTIGLSWKF